MALPAIGIFMLASGITDTLLLFVAVLALLVGLLALASYTGVSVVQRFREIAVLKAIGGRAPAIAGLVIFEALFVAVLGWVLAMGLAPAVSRQEKSVDVPGLVAVLAANP